MAQPAGPVYARQPHAGARAPPARAAPVPDPPGPRGPSLGGVGGAPRHGGGAPWADRHRTPSGGRRGACAGRGGSRGGPRHAPARPRRPCHEPLVPGQVRVARGAARQRRPAADQDRAHRRRAAPRPPPGPGAWLRDASHPCKEVCLEAHPGARMSHPSGLLVCMLLLVSSRTKNTAELRSFLHDGPRALRPTSHLLPYVAPLAPPHTFCPTSHLLPHLTPPALHPRRALTRTRQAWRRPRRWRPPRPCLPSPRTTGRTRPRWPRSSPGASGSASPSGWSRSTEPPRSHD